MIDGLKKLGPHGFSQVLLVDGQQQQEITGEGLWHAQVTDAGQDGDRHPDTLHASAGNSVQACHEPWRKGNRTNEDLISRTAGGRVLPSALPKSKQQQVATYSKTSSFPLRSGFQTLARRSQCLDDWPGILHHTPCSVRKKSPNLINRASFVFLPFFSEKKHIFY